MDDFFTYQFKNRKELIMKNNLRKRKNRIEWKDMIFTILLLYLLSLINTQILFNVILDIFLQYLIIKYFHRTN